MRFSYNYRTDELFMGLNCYGICGDADGDGNPGGASNALTQRGGADLPNFANSESALIAIDFGSPTGGDPDGIPDIILGYPSQEADGSDRFPCASMLFDTACFGLYLYLGPGLDRANTRFLYKSSSPVLPHAAQDWNPTPSLGRPDLEWSIKSLRSLQQKGGWPQSPANGDKEWFFNALVTRLCFSVLFRFAEHEFVGCGVGLRWFVPGRWYR